MSLNRPSIEPIQRNESARDDEFWRTHGGVGLVWSNPQASDDVMICHALLKPGFHLLLDIAVRFGFARLERLWAELRQDVVSRQFPEEIEELKRAEPTVERCLSHMQEGMRRS